MLKTEHAAIISQPGESDDLTEKMNLLSETVQSLLDRDQTFDEEIVTIKSDFEAMEKGLTNQVRQINVSLIRFLNEMDIKIILGKSEWNIHIRKFM